MDDTDRDYSITSCSLASCDSTNVQQAFLFSASQDAEPAIVEGGIYSYEHNAVNPRFSDSDTSVDEPDEERDEYARTIVLSTTVPLRGFFGDTNYGLQSPWPTSDNEFFSGGGEHGYTSAGSVLRQPRRPVGKVSTTLVAWNVFDMMINLSILAMPYAVAKGGLIVIPLIPFIATMSGYTGKLLIDCMYEHSVRRRKYKSRVRLDYIEIGQDFTNSEAGGKTIMALQVINMLCLCILNITVLGQLLFEILHSYLSTKICTVIGVAIAFPTFFISRLGLIAWMHLVGVASLFIGLCLIEGYCFASHTSWHLSSIPYYDLEKLPISIGIIMCSFGVHSALPGIEQQMEKPKHYRPMLLFSCTTAVLVNVLIGFPNAMLYGNQTDEVITVDLELHYGLGISSAVFIFFSVLCLFALPMFVIMEGIDATIAEIVPFFQENANGYSIVLSIFNRLIIMGFSLTVAILVPHFALLMGFVGNTINTLLSLIIPCVFHLKLKKARLRWYHHICNRLIIVFGIASMCIGVYFTCKEMHQQL